MREGCKKETDMRGKNFDLLAELTRVLQLEGKAILQCADRMTRDPANPFKRALEIFDHALSGNGKIVVTGLGKSGKVGQKIVATLCSTGSFAVYLHPTEGLHGDLGIVSPRDAVLALSYTGNTDELVRLLPSLKRMQVPVVALCGNKNSQLAEQCDVWLDASVDQEACPHNLAPTSSTTLALALGDAIAITLMQLRGFDAVAFARTHPGGSIGNRLTLRVADVMQKGTGVATVSADASMDEVVIVSTQKKLGAVLVVEGPKLLGIITDGDLRRALQHREKFFSFKAADIMTRDPVTVTTETLAKNAIDLMENRPSQISVLPVLDMAGNWHGIIRLHDLARCF